MAGKVPATLSNRLGIAIAKRTYKAVRNQLDLPRWLRIYNAGARPQRLLWASTGTKDPQASDVLYIKALAAPFTVNTMPEGTLKALADHGELNEIMSADGGDSEATLDQFAKAGIDVDGETIGADAPCKSDREPSRADPNIGDLRAFCDAERVHDLLGLLPVVTVRALE